MKKSIIVIAILAILVGLGFYFKKTPEVKQTDTKTEVVADEKKYIIIINADGSISQYLYTGKGYLSTTDKDFDLYADNGDVIYTSINNAKLSEEPSRVVSFDYSDNVPAKEVTKYNSPRFSYAVIKKYGITYLYKISDTKAPKIENGYVTITTSTNQEIITESDLIWLYSSKPDYLVDLDKSKE